MKQQKKKNQEIKEEDKFTQIYLVTNCYEDPNKVYIGKEKSHQTQINGRKSSHKTTFGKQIIFEYIDKCNGWNSKQWLPLESFWIEQFRQWGFQIMNGNKGGGGCDFRTEKSKNQISKSLKGKKRNNESKNKMRESALGRKNTIIQKQKLSISLRKYYSNNLGPFFNKKHKEETKIKVRRIIQVFDKNLNLIQEFPSLKDTGLYFQTHSGNIITRIKNNKPLKNYYFKYKNEKTNKNKS